MDTIFMITENRRTSEYPVLVLKLNYKLDSKKKLKTCCFIKS